MSNLVCLHEYGLVALLCCLDSSLQWAGCELELVQSLVGTLLFGGITHLTSVTNKGHTDLHYEHTGFTLTFRNVNSFFAFF